MANYPIEVSGSLYAFDSIEMQAYNRIKPHLACFVRARLPICL